MTTGVAVPWWFYGVTWIVVIAGWVIVHRATLFRERRREKREASRQIVSDLHALEKLACDFHRADRFDEYAAAELLVNSERFIRMLQRAPFSELRIAPTLLKALRQSITRRNTDRSTFLQQFP